MVLRYALIVFVMLAALLPASTLQAQEAGVLCGTLTAEDCELLRTAVNNMTGMSGFNNDFTLILGGAGGTSAGNSLTVSGTGPMRLTSGGAIEAANFSFDVVVGEDNASGEILVVDNTLYMRLADEGWRTLPEGEQVSDIVVALLDGSVLAEVFGQPGVTNVTRAEDVTENGVTYTAFTYDVDLSALFATNAVITLIEGLVTQLPADQQEQLGGQDIAGALQFLPLLFTSDVIQAGLWVGEDGYVSRVVIDINLEINAGFVDPNAEPISFVMNLVTDLNGYDTEFSVEAPAEADPLDINLEDTLNSFTSGGGGAAAEEEVYTVEAPLAYGESVEGQLSDSNREDVYSFTATEGDVITVTMRASEENSSLDTTIYLYNSAFEQLAANDDHESENPELDIFDSEITSFVVPADGEYIIVATWFSATADGDYILTLTQEN